MNEYKIKKLLYVEDEISAQEELKDILEDFCEELICANNGKEGLDLYIEHRPQLIVSDIQMPIMNGIDMIKNIINIDSDVNVIFTTAFSDSNYFLDSIELQVEGYILKPVSLKLLIKKIEQIISNLNLQKYLDEKNKALNEQSKKLKQAQKISKLGYWSYDLKNDFIELSEEIHTIFETDINTYIPSFETFLNFIHKDDKSRVKEIYKLGYKEPNNYEIKYRIVTKNSQEKWIQVNFISNSENGKIVSFSGTIHDITELMNAQIKALESEKIKSEFLANMSHEIRTPLTAIIGMTDILLDKEDISSENLKSLNIIKDSSNLLINTINDILDFSALQVGKYKITEKSFSINNFIKQIRNIVDIKNKNKELEIIINVDKNLPDILLGDQFRLEQILLNLLSNSIKFTQKGYIELNITEKNKDENNNLTICFEVNDTGIGISDEVKKNLFTAFVQGENSNTRINKGTGLGLVITKRIIELMKGSISYESTLNVGTKFTVEIPIKVSKEITSNENQELTQIKGNKTALLVEDDKINQIVISKTLSKIGLDVSFVDDGLQAIENLKQSSYDIVFMDIHMPVMDGWEATKEIRKFNSTIPIVALSAGVMTEDINKSLESGMNDHICKPVDKNDLNRILNKYLSA